MFNAATYSAGFGGNAIQAEPEEIQAMYESKYVGDPTAFLGPGRVMEGIATRPGRAFDEQQIIAETQFSSSDTKEEVEQKREALRRLGLDPSTDYGFRYLNPESEAYQRQQARYEALIAAGAMPARQLPAGLTDIPTSTTNYSRPRTVAAGWAPNPDEHELGTLTVVFRDGTPYNFYNVPRSVWIKFHQSISKGRPFLNKTFPVQYEHGPADLSSLPEETRQAIMDGVYLAARTKQIYYRNPSTGKGHYTTKYGTKKTLTKRDRAVLDENGNFKRDKRGYYIVKKRVKTYGAPQGPYKKNTNPAENRAIAQAANKQAQAEAAARQKAKANKAPKRNTSAQRKK